MDWTIEFDKAIEQYLPDLEVLQDEPEPAHLLPHRRSGKADGIFPAGSSWCC